MPGVIYLSVASAVDAEHVTGIVSCAIVVDGNVFNKQHKFKLLPNSTWKTSRRPHHTSQQYLRLFTRSLLDLSSLVRRLDNLIILPVLIQEIVQRTCEYVLSHMRAMLRQRTDLSEMSSLEHRGLNVSSEHLRSLC